MKILKINLKNVSFIKVDFITSDKFYSPKMEEKTKGNISNPDVKTSCNNFYL